MSTALKLPVSIEDYLQAEEVAEFKSEYHNGQVFPVSGATRRHVLITDNVVGLLRASLKESCVVYSSNLRLWIDSPRLFTYPNAMVSCGEERMYPGPTESLMNPVLIIEVLSKSTRNYDRGDKFMFCRSIPSLQEYLTIEQSRYGVEQWTRKNQRWQLEESSDPNGRVELLCGVAMKMTDIYRRIQMEEEE